MDRGKVLLDDLASAQGLGPGGQQTGEIVGQQDGVGTVLGQIRAPAMAKDAWAPASTGASLMPSPTMMLISPAASRALR